MPINGNSHPAYAEKDIISHLAELVRPSEPNNVSGGQLNGLASILVSNIQPNDNIVSTNGSKDTNVEEGEVLNSVLHRASAEEDFGLHLVQSSEQVLVGQVKGPASISNLQTGDIIMSINGSKVTNVEEGQVLLEQCDATKLNITVYRNKSFKQLVEKEFSQEFLIVWRDSNICEIERKDNPDDCSACFFSQRVAVISYTLSLRSGGQIEWVDNLSDSCCRITKDEISRHERLNILVAGHNKMLVQSLLRIESQLAGRVTGSELAVAATTIAPLPQAMVRMDDNEDKPSVPSVSDEISKLKALLDDGTLSEEEFRQAKKKILLS